MMHRFLVAGLLLVSALTIADAQRRGGGAREEFFEENVPYDGRFTFVRIRYSMGGSLGSFRGRDLTWSHDYPRAERHFSKILDELTTIGPRVANTNIMTFDDPELFRFPVAYLCEPGFWVPSETEVAGLRAYLQKGGFLIIDDFQGNQIFNLEQQLRRVLPEARMLPIPISHPIFDAFYRITTFDSYTHPYSGAQTQFFGVFEQNDPTRRPLIVINYNGDIAEYWEFSDIGAFPIDLSNEAYKLGVNYIVYALTR